MASTWKKWVYLCFPLIPLTICCPASSETVAADVTVSAEPPSLGRGSGTCIFITAFEFFWHHFTATAPHSGSRKATESTETEPARPSHPPPIPPRWTRPDFGITSTTLELHSVIRRSASVPPSSGERCVTTANTNATSQPTIQLEATLSASLANLTLNNSPANISASPPRAATRVYPPSALKSPTKKLKFYSVTIGKRTGVFTNW